jgi:4-carboxymuconolactone decarboxylase
MERYEIGIDTFKQLDPTLGEIVMQQLHSNNPDLHKFAVEYFGDFYQRTQVDLKTRVLVTISAAAALGNAPGILEFHIHAALNLDCTMDEIVEVISQITLFAGFPAVMTALKIAKKAFIDRGLVQN